MLTQARLKELLRYIPKTGKFFWKVAPNNRVYVGMRAGRLEPNGYWRIRIDGKAYSGHRLAWLYMYGYFPHKQIDHVRGNRASCKLSDLRLATHGQNMMNKKACHNGLKGAHRHKGKWESKIESNGVQIYLGRYATPEAAHTAYCRAAKKLHGEFFSAG